MEERMTLQQFAELLQPYRESVQAANERLRDLSALHQDGGVLTVQERKGLLRALAALATVYDGFLARVEASAQLPLAVIAGRLPLMEALSDAKHQALALAQQFAALELSPTRRDLSDWWATEQAIGALQRANAAVGDEARHLLDRARFTERVPQARPRQHRATSGRPGRADD